MKFQPTKPEGHKFHIGEGHFLVDTDNPIVAKLLSHAPVQNHSDILQKKFAALTTAGRHVPDGDLVAVFSKAEKTAGGCNVFFDYYIV